MWSAGHRDILRSLLTVGREDNPTAIAHRMDVHNADNEYDDLVSLQYI
jgi:hypothetical protein